MHTTGHYCTAALTHGGYSERYLPADVQAKLKVWREAAICAGCQQRIALHLTPAVRGIQVYHPGCSKRYDERATTVPKAPQIIGTIVGIAIRYGVNGIIRQRTADGEEFYIQERIARDALSDSVAAGGQELRIQHGAAAIPGVLKLFDEPESLLFRFTVHDSPLGRRAYDGVKRGLLHGVSISYRCNREDKRFDYRYRAEVIERAHLVEISLTDRPAWWGTTALIES